MAIMRPTTLWASAARRPRYELVVRKPRNGTNAFLGRSDAPNARVQNPGVEAADTAIQLNTIRVNALFSWPRRFSTFHFPGQVDRLSRSEEHTSELQSPCN